MAILAVSVLLVSGVGIGHAYIASVTCTGIVISSDYYEVDVCEMTSSEPEVIEGVGYSGIFSLDGISEEVLDAGTYSLLIENLFICISDMNTGDTLQPRMGISLTELTGLESKSLQLVIDSVNHGDEKTVTEEGTVEFDTVDLMTTGTNTYYEFQIYMIISETTTMGVISVPSTLEFKITHYDAGVGGIE